MDWIKTFLSAIALYPWWVKSIVAVWVLISAGIIVVLILTPRSAKQLEGKGGLDQEAMTVSSAEYKSHMEAATAKALKMDCSRYRMESSPDISTAAGEFCETLAELRNNLVVLFQFRTVLGREAPLPTVPPRFDRTQVFLQRRYKEEMYSPKKAKLLPLIQTITSHCDALGTIRAADKLRLWNTNSPFTVDDLIIATGFLEWMISIDAALSLKPADIYHLGPYYERAFPLTEAIAVREFSNYYGDAQSSYQDLVSAFD